MLVALEVLSSAASQAPDGGKSLEIVIKKPSAQTLAYLWGPRATEQNTPNRRTVSSEETGKGEATTSTAHWPSGWAPGLGCDPPCKLTGNLPQFRSCFLESETKGFVTTQAAAKGQHDAEPQFLQGRQGARRRGHRKGRVAGGCRGASGGQASAACRKTCPRPRRRHCLIPQSSLLQQTSKGGPDKEWPVPCHPGTPGRQTGARENLKRASPRTEPYPPGAGLSLTPHPGAFSL